jgi:drug/metabolite transporter (DMT)-like permease
MSNTDIRSSSPLLGVLLMASAVLVFVAMDSCTKWASQHHTVLQVIFVRAVGALVVALGCGAVGGWALLRARQPKFQALRAALSVISASTFFYAFSRLPLADAYAIFYVAPLAATALAALFLKEPVPARAAVAIGVGLLGVGVVMGPRLGGGETLAYAACVLGMLAYSLSSVVTRRMSAGEALPALLLYPALAMLVLTAPVMPWHWTPPTPASLAVLLTIGLLWPVGVWLVVSALRRAPVARVAPVDYSSIVWVVAIDFFVFGLPPAATTLAGSALIIAACLALLARRG